MLQIFLTFGKARPETYRGGGVYYKWNEYSESYL